MVHCPSSSMLLVSNSKSHNHDHQPSPSSSTTKNQYEDDDDDQTPQKEPITINTLLHHHLRLLPPHHRLPIPCTQPSTTHQNELTFHPLKDPRIPPYTLPIKTWFISPAARPPTACRSISSSPPHPTTSSSGAAAVGGLTFVADSFYNFENPWHGLNAPRQLLLVDGQQRLPPAGEALSVQERGGGGDGGEVGRFLQLWWIRRGVEKGAISGV